MPLFTVTFVCHIPWDFDITLRTLNASVLLGCLICSFWVTPCLMFHGWHVYLRIVMIFLITTSTHVLLHQRCQPKMQWVYVSFDISLKDHPLIGKPPFLGFLLLWHWWSHLGDCTHFLEGVLVFDESSYMSVFVTLSSTTSFVIQSCGYFLSGFIEGSYCRPSYCGGHSSLRWSISIYLLLFDGDFSIDCI